MRVLQIVDNIAIDSGVSSMIMNLYRNMDYKKVQFDFLVCSARKESYEDEIISKGGKVFYIGNPLSVKEIFQACFNFKKFFKANAFKYKIVHLHSPTIALFTLKYAKKYHILKRIVHSHSTMTSTKKIKRVINSFLIKQVRKYGNEFWACSTEAAKFLYGEKFCKANKIELIKNAIDPEKFSYQPEVRRQIRKKYSVENKIVMIHVSNYSQIKNLQFLVPVMQETLLYKNNLVFLFIGTGPTLAGFRKKLIELGLVNNCIFTGRISNVNEYLQAADLLLLPSLKEGLPVSVIEAQACGLRCLVNDTITQEANIGGVAYRSLIVKEWTKYITMQALNADEDRLQLAKSFVESQFNIKNEAKRVENLYLSLVQSKYEDDRKKY